MKIKTKVNRINKKIAELRKQLSEVQDECKHDQDVTVEYRGNSGYDYSDYWIEWTCLDCGRKWDTEQNKEAYLKQVELGDNVRELIRRNYLT